MPEPNRTSLSIPREVVKQARAKAITQDTTMTAVVTALLRLWLAGRIELTPEGELAPAGEKGGRRQKTK